MMKTCVTFILLLMVLNPRPCFPKQGVEDAVLHGTFDLNLRSYYLHRLYDKSPERETLAIGGWLGYETDWWRHLRAGLSGYTSQGLFLEDASKDGTYLLAAGQKGYTVLGKAFLEGKLSKTRICLFRQELDTPVLNNNDYRMTPVTYEAYTVESREIENLTVYASHVVKIKKWNESKFDFMSSAAGYPGTQKPVSLAGLIYTVAEKQKIQIWEYFCPDIMNMVYFQSDHEFKLTEEILFQPSVQFLFQNEIGDALSGVLETKMFGLQSVLSWKGLDLTIACNVLNSKNDAANPWDFYPGFTAGIVLDNNRAGEKTWLYGLSYDFSNIGLNGLKLIGTFTDSHTPDSGLHASPDNNELDLTVEYRLPKPFQGLKIRLRSAFIHGDKTLGGQDIEDYRVIINYNIQKGFFR